MFFANNFFQWKLLSYFFSKFRISISMRVFWYQNLKNWVSGFWDMTLQSWAFPFVHYEIWISVSPFVCYEIWISVLPFVHYEIWISVSPFVHYEIWIAMVQIDPLKFCCVRPGVAGGFPSKYKIYADHSGSSGGFSPKYQYADGPLVARTERRLGGGPPELQKDFHVDKFPKFMSAPAATIFINCPFRSTKPLDTLYLIIWSL